MTAVSRTPQHVRAVTMLVLANLFWGLSFPLIKSIGAIEGALMPGANTWFLAAGVIVPRFALGAAVLGVAAFGPLRRLTLSEVRQGVELGLFAGGGMIFQIDGLQYTPASTSAFLTQFYAILIPVWLALRARRLPPPIVGVSCALVIAGAAVLARLDWRDLRLGRGELETLVSSFFFMGQILCLDRARFGGNRAIPVTFVLFATEAVVGLALGAGTLPAGAHLLAPAGSAAWWGCTLALTAFCTIGAFTLMNAWQPKITATEAGLIYCAEPVFASAMALFLPGWLSRWAGIDYPNERATAALLVGGGLVTAANVLLQWRPPPKDQVAA